MPPKVRTRRQPKADQEATQQAEFSNNTDFISLDPEAAEDEAANDDPGRDQNQNAFYGLLDRAELEYFKSAESTLSANALMSDERQPFIDNVFEEIKGKELKLATHQICSKLIERLVMLASDEQLLALLLAFQGHTYRLAISKYSSHCLETLFVKCASLHQDELVKTMQELVPHVSVLSKEKYGSHVLRLVLLLTCGLPTDLAARSKKSGDARKHTDMETISASSQRVVPAAFSACNSELMSALSKDQDSTTLRRIAIDPLGSPLLQVMIRVQASKSNFTLVDLVMGPQVEGSEVFVDHLLSEPTGCHFLQVVVECLPKKKLGPYFTAFFKGKIHKLCLREYANYVVQALIKSKLGAKNELFDELTPNLVELVNSERSSIVALMVEHSTPDVRARLLDTVLNECPIEKFLTSTSIPDALFIETALKYSPGLCNTLLQKLDPTKLQDMAVHPVQSHIIEALLNPGVDQVERRKILAHFVPIAVDLACNAYGSHVVDKLPAFCFKLKFARERIADELSKNEDKVKHSIYGKNVWKNWNLDKYVHKRFQWWDLVKEQEDKLQEAYPQKAKTPRVKPVKRSTPYERK